MRTATLTAAAPLALAAALTVATPAWADATVECNVNAGPVVLSSPLAVLTSPIAVPR
jgi:hypothetical protein